ncbi:hypothetical protein CRENBAI_010709 [Crenichthys baileyi]|uniref:Uncharacterized protein n=1 Tax=Crenichthys baileyi TaxID=28760 RepID=A0AAV9R6W2_9TELE
MVSLRAGGGLVVGAGCLPPGKAARHQCLCQCFSGGLFDSLNDKLLPKKRIHGKHRSTDAEGRLQEFSGVYIPCRTAIVLANEEIDYCY